MKRIWMSSCLCAVFLFQTTLAFPQSIIPKTTYTGEIIAVASNVVRSPKHLIRWTEGFFSDQEGRLMRQFLNRHGVSNLDQEIPAIVYRDGAYYDHKSGAFVCSVKFNGDGSITVEREGRVALVSSAVSFEKNLKAVENVFYSKVSATTSWIGNLVISDALADKVLSGVGGGVAGFFAFIVTTAASAAVLPVLVTTVAIGGGVYTIDRVIDHWDGASLSCKRGPNRELSIKMGRSSIVLNFERDRPVNYSVVTDGKSQVTYFVSPKFEMIGRQIEGKAAEVPVIGGASDTEKTLFESAKLLNYVCNDPALQTKFEQLIDKLVRKVKRDGVPADSSPDTGSPAGVAR